MKPIRINIVTTTLPKRQIFNGYLLCLFEYAHWLSAQGHQVNVVPMGPSRYPEWFGKDIGTLVSPPRRSRLALAAAAAFRLLSYLWAVAFRQPLRARIAHRMALRKIMSEFTGTMSRLLDTQTRMGIACSYLGDVMPEADVTVATNATSAILTALTGTGELVYLSQAYEPDLAVANSDPRYDRREAELSYRLGLRMIANSNWLRQKILEHAPGAEIELCPNGYDQSVFHGTVKEPSDKKEVTVLSYGGYAVEWKGLPDMVKAMKIAKERLPDWRIRWLVYGDPSQFLVSPDNDVAPFEPLGFLLPEALAEAYRQADVFLSACWFEALPMFWIEGMACGIPVVMTQPSPDAYATPGEDAEIVRARDIENIAEGFCRVVTDLEYRKRLSVNGLRKCQEYTWDRAGSTLQRILTQSPLKASAGLAASGG